MKRTLLSLLSLCALSLYAQSDSLSTRSIDELVVEEVRQPLVRYNTLGKTYWAIETMESMPMADPLRNIQLLPGVQTASENVGGTFVQGCDNSHNYTTINGAPVYYPMHLLGYFSTFNSSYFKDLTFSKSMHLTTANRLGAEVGMETADTIPHKLRADMDLGLLSAQGAVQMPLGERLSLAVGGRYSNVNILYDRLINSMLKNQRIAYWFYDVNVGLQYNPTDRDYISIDYFRGCDNADFKLVSYMMDTEVEWGNRTASVRWKRKGDQLSHDQLLYYSAYHSKLNATQTDSHVYVPAGIHTLGARSEQRYMGTLGVLTYGGEAMWHTIAPQAPQITGSYGVAYTPIQEQQAAEGALFFQSDVVLGNGVELIAGLRASGFHNALWRVGGDPKVALRYQPSSITTWQLTAGTYTQYLHQVGFSANGLPSEFWVVSDKDIVPQHAGKLSLALQQDILDRRYRISVETYFTRLTGQVEYKGNVLALLTEVYDLKRNLVVGDGYNYGIDLMLQKNFGRLTGWVSYSWGKAPRSFVRDGELVTYPSVHNREHDLNAVAHWSITDKWGLSATFIYATGTPYTEVKSAYILGENGIVNYEKHNSSRYPALKRLDLALVCQLPKVGDVDHSAKFSVYNATFAQNPIAYTYHRYEGNVIYKQPVCWFLTAIPSVSYYMHF